MSVTLRAFMIGLTSYQAVQGSGDLALVDRILEHAQDSLAAEDDWLKQLRPDHLPIAAALTDIVMNTLRQGRSAALSYQIAAVVLAEHLGERIDDEAIAESYASVTAEIDAAISEWMAECDGGAWPLLADVLTRGTVLAIPRVRETLPNGTGVLAEDEVRCAAAVVARLPVHQGDDARGLAMIYGSWLNQAAESNRALLLACD